MPSLDDCPQTAPPTPSRAAGLPRNWWLLCVGITGWIQSECPAALRRNAHVSTQNPVSEDCQTCNFASYAIGVSEGMGDRLSPIRRRSAQARRLAKAACHTNSFNMPEV